MTKLHNLRTAHEALLASMYRVEERQAEISAQFQGSPCCPDCGARNGSKEYVGLCDRYDRQHDQLRALEAKIYRAAACDSYLLNVFERVISGDITVEELATGAPLSSLRESLVEIKLSLYSIGSWRERLRPVFEVEAKRMLHAHLLQEIADHPALPPAARPVFQSAVKHGKAAFDANVCLDVLTYVPRRYR